HRARSAIECAHDDAPNPPRAAVRGRPRADAARAARGPHAARAASEHFGRRRLRGSLEGWARAGIRYVELTDVLLDEFLENDTLDGARRLLADLGLTPVSAAAVLPDVWIPGPEREASLETWRKRCEQFAALGLDRIYCPSIT